MKKLTAFILSLICIFGLVSCKKDTDYTDFLNYEKDCLSIVQFVLDYPGELGKNIPSYTLDINK